MMLLDEIEEKVKSKLHAIYVEAIDLRGGNHIQLTVVSPSFEDKNLVEQHKLVYDIFASEMSANIIHALTLKTYSPSHWQLQLK